MEQEIEKAVESAMSRAKVPEGAARGPANNTIPKLKRWQSQ